MKKTNQTHYLSISGVHPNIERHCKCSGARVRLMQHRTGMRKNNRF